MLARYLQLKKLARFRVRRKQAQRDAPADVGPGVKKDMQIKNERRARLSSCCLECHRVSKSSFQSMLAKPRQDWNTVRVSTIDCHGIREEDRSGGIIKKSLYYTFNWLILHQIQGCHNFFASRILCPPTFRPLNKFPPLFMSTKR